MKSLTCFVGLFLAFASTTLSQAADKPAGHAHRGGKNGTLELLAPFRVPMKLNMAYTDANPPAPFGMWEDVSHWQNFLLSHGYHTNTKIDGKFGNNTKTDTAAFQNDNHLNANGTVDKDTYCAARNMATDPLRPYPPTPTFTCPTALKRTRLFGL